MQRFVSRRDFLKLTGLLPLSLASPRWMKIQAPLSQQRNVIVVVADALSAYNISLYGYARQTMPNLAHLADRAIVYHNHFAAGNYTTPGTASLLTGTYPWTHRAIQPNTRAADRFVTENMFSAFRDYYRVAYTHNGWAYTLLRQFQNSIDDLIPWQKLFLRPYDSFVADMFGNDQDIASVSWVRSLSLKDYGYAYSLFVSHLYDVLQQGNAAELKRLFPRGVPTIEPDDDFLLEQAVDYMARLLPTIPQPFLLYFHFLPPHAPYNTSAEFYNRFKGDGFAPARKPEDIFSQRVPEPTLLRSRTEYDEFLLYVDREFGRFFDFLETSRLLDNTLLVFTSDHGEMFERGIRAHTTEVLYQPLVRVPLLIFDPGRPGSMHIHTPTSAVDVLPTLAHITGHSSPDWTEGALLPPYADGNADPTRGVYAVQARRNGQYAPLTRATTMLVREQYKLLYYLGYTEKGIQELVKLYDIQADPEELFDLSSRRPKVAAELLDELKSKLTKANQAYL